MVGLLKSSIERKKQEANLRAADASVGNSDPNPLGGANQTGMIHFSSNLVTRNPIGQTTKLTTELQVPVDASSGAVGLGLPGDHSLPSRQLQVNAPTPGNDVGQTTGTCIGARDIASQPSLSPCRSLGEEKVLQCFGHFVLSACFLLYVLQSLTEDVGML